MDKSSVSSRARDARVLTHDSEQLMPHGTYQGRTRAVSAGKTAAQTITGPLEHAVARDAECHLGLDHLDGVLMQCENAKIFWVSREVEHDQQDTNGLRR